MSSERRERGAKVFEEVIGYPPPARGPAFLELTLTNLFADVWGRPGLSVRDRRLVTLTVLLLSLKEDSVRGHLAQALRSGDLTKREVNELVIHLAHYAGWPVGQFAFDVASKVYAELDAERAAADPTAGVPEPQP